MGTGKPFRTGYRSPSGYREAGTPGAARERGIRLRIGPTRTQTPL